VSLTWSLSSDDDDDVSVRCLDVTVITSTSSWHRGYDITSTLSLSGDNDVRTTTTPLQWHKDVASSSASLSRRRVDIIMTPMTSCRRRRRCRLRFIDIVIATFSRCRRGHNDIDTSALWGSTAVAVPPPFRPSDPALCGSSPLVTPYCCRLGDLLCFVFIVWLLYVWCLYCMFLQYFDTVG